MDLIFRVKADYDEVIRCQEELKKVEARLKAVDENTDPKEIQRLMLDYTRLSTQIEKNTSRVGRLGVFMKDAFKSVGDFLRGNNKELEKSSDNERTLLGNLKARLSASEMITESLKKQREEAKAVNDHAKEAYEASLKQQKRVSDYYEKKFNGDVDAAASDPEASKQMMKALAVTERWKNELEKSKEKVEVLDSLLHNSEKSTENLRKEYERITTIDVSDNEMLKNLSEQSDAANEHIKKLKEDLETLEKEKVNIEISIKKHDANIESIKEGIESDKEIADLERIDVSGKISNLNSELDNLHTHIGTLLNDYTTLQGVQADQSAKVDELKEKVRQHGEAEYNLKQQLYSLTEGTEKYNQVQQQIDYHHRELERYTELQKDAQDELTETKNKMADVQQQLDRNRESLSAKESEKSELLKHYDELTEKLDANSSENEALKAAIEKKEKDNALLEQNNKQIEETNEKLSQSIDLSTQLKDMVDAYGKVYEGFSKTEVDNPATRVFTNEEEYNRSQELHSQAGKVEEELMSGNLSEANLRQKQQELEAIQAELVELDEKAIRAGESLGAKLGAQAQQMTERLYNANKQVKDTATQIFEADSKLKALQDTLEQLKNVKSDEELEKNRAEINKTEGEILNLTDRLKELREQLASAAAEQKDAQDEINKTGGELGTALKELKSNKGVFAEIDEAVSYLPEPLQKVATGIKGVGKAMQILIKNPLMVAIAGIVLALQALWQWFQKTEEGQRAFAKISGYIGGVLSRLEDIVISVGGAIFKFGKIAYQAFQNPQKAIKDFLLLIREKIWKMVSTTGEMFGALGTLIADIFTGKWDKLGKDFDNLKGKAKAAFDANPVGMIVNGVKKATKATQEWFGETHKVAKESSKIKQDEIALGDEIEKNREKTIKLQKSMAELQATMRNTNLSKAERQKAMEDYKKAVEQQAKIQRDFAEKRRSIQQRKMDLSPYDTIEERRQLEHLTNDVLQEDLNMQRQLTSLQRIDNSINKKTKGGGKTKEQLQEEYANLLDEQAQKQAKQIRENGYIIEQARIDSMKEGTEKTIAQMKLDYKKELDAATEYENELTREKLKFARQEFYKDPKNKKKAFDATAVDVSMTDQERQVSAAKVSDAQTKYQQKIESLYSKYDTFAEKRTKAENDFNALQNFNASQITEKTLEIGRLYDELSGKSGKDADIIKKKITILEQEIGLLEEKGLLIEANKKAQMSELEGMLAYMKQFGSMQQKQAAIIQEYENKIALARAEGNTWEVKRLEKEKGKEEGKLKADELLKGIDFSRMVDGVGGVVRAMATKTYNDIQEYKKTDQYKSSKFEEKKAISELEQQMIAKGGAGAASPFSLKSWDNLSKATKKYQESLLKLQVKTQAHTNAVNKQKEAQEKLDKAQKGTTEYLIALAEAANAAAEAERTKAEQEEAEQEKNDSEGEVNESSTRLKQGMDNFNTILGQITSGTVSGLADGVANIIAAMDKNDENDMGGLAGLGKIGGIISAILALVDALGAEPTKLIDDLLTKVAAVIEGVISELWDIVAAIIEGIGNIIGSIGTGIASWFTGEDYNSNRAEVEKENKRLTMAMQVNTEAINRLTKAMENSTPTEATKYYEQAKALIESNERNEIRQMTNNAYMYDGGHSLNYDFGSGQYLKGPNGEALQLPSMLLGKENKIYKDLMAKGYVDTNIIEEIFKKVEKTPIEGDYTFGGLIQSLTAGDWKKLYEDEEGRRLMKLLGSWISEAEDEGNYNGMFGDIMNLINEYGDAYDDLIDKFNESITHISFDSMYSSFVSSLMDMDKKASDFANDFEGYIRNAIYQSLLAGEVEEELKKWYGAFASYLKDDGKITEAEINRLRHTGGTYTDDEGVEHTYQSIDAITESALDLRDTIEQLGLYNGKNRDQQSATANSIQNISYDQADAISGILLSHTIIFEQIKSILEKWSGESAGEVAGKITKVVEDNAKANDTSVKVITTLTDEFQKAMDGATPLESDIMQLKDAIGEAFNSIPIEEIMASVGDMGTAEMSILNASVELLYAVGIEHRDIAADSRDILAGMAIHVEEIRDGMVDTLVPRIKNIDNELVRVRKVLEEQ